jgi:hypothetical protein
MTGPFAAAHESVAGPSRHFAARTASVVFRPKGTLSRIYERGELRLPTSANPMVLSSCRSFRHLERVMQGKLCVIQHDVHPVEKGVTTGICFASSKHLAGAAQGIRGVAHVPNGD